MVVNRNNECPQINILYRREYTQARGSNQILVFLIPNDGLNSYSELTKKKMLHTFLEFDISKQEKGNRSRDACSKKLDQGQRQAKHEMQTMANRGQVIMEERAPVVA